jgi:hypothetical protein
MHICGLHPLSLCRYSNEIDGLAWACAEPMFDNRYSSEHHNGHWFHHRDNQDTVKDLQSALLVSLRKTLVDVLRQHSLPTMDLRIATYLTIALLPNHEKTSVGVSLNALVRPPFRRYLPRAPRPPGAPMSFCFRSSFIVLERTRLRNEVTEAQAVGLNWGFTTF